MLGMMVVSSLLPAGFEWTAYQDFAAQAQSGSWRFQLQWLTIFAAAYLISFRHRAKALAIAKSINPFLLVMLAYCALNVLWSAEPTISSKRVFQFCGIIMVSVAFQLSDRPPLHLMGTIATVIAGIIIASTAMALVNPSVGHDADFGSAWRGILTTKNDLGYVGALGVILWVARADHPGLHWSLILGCLGLALLCIIKATSSTGISTAILGVTVYLVLRKRYIGTPLWLTQLLAGISVLALLGFFGFYFQESRMPRWEEIIGPFAALFGKSTDLTGRTDIWEYVFLEILKHPWFGVGWGAFWLGPGSASQPVLDELPWIPFQAHNGYLDILNELGVVGLTIFALMLLLHIRQLILIAHFDRSQAAFHSTLLVIILFSNFSESSLYKAVAAPHIMLILSIVSVSSILRSQRISRDTSVSHKGDVGNSTSSKRNAAETGH